MQQLRMPPHERQWSTTLLPLSRSRTPPSRSQHIDSRSLEDRVAAGISLLGRGCGALGAERGNKTSERLFRPFCPLLDPPRFRNSPSRYSVGSETTAPKCTSVRFVLNSQPSRARLSCLSSLRLPHACLASSSPQISTPSWSPWSDCAFTCALSAAISAACCLS